MNSVKDSLTQPLCSSLSLQTVSMDNSLINLSLMALFRADFLSDITNLVSELPDHLKDKIRTTLSSRRNGLEKLGLLNALIHPRLTELDLSQVENINDEALISASHAYSLQVVNLNANNGEFRNSITPNGLMKLLDKKEALISLHLRGNVTAVNDEVLEFIGKNCPRICRLDISRCGSVAGERGLIGIRELPLSSLSLSETNVDDAALSKLCEGDCKSHLAELRIDGCFEVSDVGVEAVLSACHLLNIFIFNNCPKLTQISRRALEDYVRRNRVMQVAWTVPLNED